jgi:hypothetical protein
MDCHQLVSPEDAVFVDGKTQQRKGKSGVAVPFSDGILCPP